MKILALSDVKAKKLYDYYRPGCLREYDLIIACGDLPKYYLEFFVTMARCPVFYVHGNHDDSFADNPPEGCECIDGDLVVYQGIRILGLGGSYRYKDGRNMYTERQMKRRIWKLMPKIWRHKGFDILVAHAPARNHNDFDYLSHRGFECFCTLLKKYQPKYFFHGHIHRNYGIRIPQKSKFEDTVVINAYEYCEIEYEKKDR